MTEAACEIFVAMTLIHWRQQLIARHKVVALLFTVLTGVAALGQTPARPAAKAVLTDAELENAIRRDSPSPSRPRTSSRFEFREGLRPSRARPTSCSAKARRPVWRGRPGQGRSLTGSR